MASKQQAVQEFDPKYEWQENAANFVLRVHLSGFRKEDFRVQVDGAGRLTVRGQRADGGKHVRFHKVFQLPSTSNLDDISGRFDAGVLALTVPKRPAPPPATIDDIRKQQPTKQLLDEAKPKEAEKADAPKKEAAETKKKPGDTKQKEAAETKEKPEEKKQKEPAETKKKPEETKQKEPAETKKKPEEKKQKEPAETKKKPEEAEQRKEETHKSKEEATATKKAAEEAEKEDKIIKPPEQEQKTKAEESLSERVRRRAEEERTKAEAAERKQSACGGGWKERVAEELQGLRSSDWAEGVVETVKKNKEVIAAAVAAFSLGLFVSSRLFSRN